MKVTCEYCGSNIDDTLASCPNCGAVNKHMMRSANQVPKTIEELEQFIKDKNIDAEKMRFFIGVDYKQPKAFGIFKDPSSRIVTVYKNKANGERAIRYKGDDEAYAVNEIYQKMKTELIQRRQADLNKPAAPRPSGKSGPSMPLKIFLMIFMLSIMVPVIFACCMVILFAKKTPGRGYYSYGGDRYYYDTNSWYLASSDGEWERTSCPDDLRDNYSDYFECRDYSSLDDDFADVVEEFPTEANSYNDDNDNDNWDSDNWNNDNWDYNYGGWNAGNTDWDSNW